MSLRTKYQSLYLAATIAWLLSNSPTVNADELASVPVLIVAPQSASYGRIVNVIHAIEKAAARRVSIEMETCADDKQKGVSVTIVADDAMDRSVVPRLHSALAAEGVSDITIVRWRDSGEIVRKYESRHSYLSLLKLLDKRRPAIAWFRADWSARSMLVQKQVFADQEVRAAIKASRFALVVVDCTHVARGRFADFYSDHAIPSIEIWSRHHGVTELKGNVRKQVFLATLRRVVRTEQDEKK